MANLATISNNILADSGIDPIDLIVGTGTVDYIAKFTAEGAIGNSIMSQSGSNILINGNITLHAGNYNNYAPTLTGGGASGNWGINITGKSEQVTINYGDNTNANFYMLFGSGNSLFATGLIYLNAFTDTIYAAAYRGSANVGGTGEATYHPAGIYSTGTEWFYGTMYRNGSATYHANGGLYQVGLLELNNGFQIGQVGGTNYAQFNSWVFLPSYHGLYSGQNGAHFSPNDGTYGAWKMQGTRNGYGGIEFVSGNGNITLMIEPTSNATGFHNNSYGWQFLWSNGSLYVYKNSYGGGSNSLVLDTSNYNSYAPTLTGGGASGTWGINITGNADTVDGLHASAFALVNGNTGQSFSVFELTYAQTQFNPSLAPRTGLNPMSIKMWDNYFAGIGLGSDYGTVMNYYGRGAHVDTQVYFDAGGGSWYRSAAYAAGWQSWQKYVTENGGTWNISISGGSATSLLLSASGSLLTQYGSGTIGYSYALTAGTSGLFPSSDNSNAIITVNRHPGDYYSQLGFSSNGELYYRRFSAAAINTSLPWVTLLTSNNYNSYAPTLTGGGASGTWGITATGNVVSRTQSTWQDGSLVINNVVGLLAWKNYGNNHVIFDASQGVSPSGTSVNQANPDVLWAVSYPTLMGWNGFNTYGVRVDSARVADSAGSVDFNSLTNKTGGTGTYQTSGDFRAPVFYDSNDTSYYLNPNGQSVLYSAQFNAAESINLYGVRGRFTNEYIHLYNKVGVGDPNGWGSGETSTPIFGFSTYGGANFAYGNGALSTFNGQVNIKGSSMYVTASQLHIGQQSAGTAQMSFESWGAYTGAIAMNSAGAFTFGGQGASSWFWKTYCTYNGDYSTSGNVIMSLNSGGSLFAAGDMRAPIFYDSQDTNYYVDPNGYSQFKAIGLEGGYVQYGTSLGSPSANFGNGRAYLYVWPVASGGRIISFKLNISSTWNWTSAFGYISADVSFYFDGTNLVLATTTITSATGQARLHLGIGQPVLANGFVAIPIYSANSNAVFAKFEGSPSFAWNVISWGPWESVGFPGAAVVSVPGDITVGGAVFAPVYYDSENTAYYLNPAGTSNLYTVNALNTYVGNAIYFGGGNNYLNWDGSGISSNVHIQSNASMRAPIFYDSQNTAYYLDPSNFSNLYSASFASTVNFAANTNWFGGYGPGSGPGISFENQGTFARIVFWGLDFYDWNDGIQMTLNNGYVSVNNYLQAGNSLRAPIFYDSNDTTFYLDPNATSNLYKIRIGNGAEVPGLIGMGASYLYGMGVSGAYTTVHAHPSANGVALGYFDGTTFTTRFYVNNDGNAFAVSSMRAPVFYDSQDITYYLDPNAGSRLSSLTTEGRIYSNEWIQFSNGTGIYSPINGAHFRPNQASYGPWLVTGTRNGWSGIEFESLSNGNVTMMIASNSNTSGWHNNSYGWHFQWSNGTAYVYKNSYGGGTAATVLDSANYNSYAPTLTGGGASGTWGINITGSAATATSLTTNYAGGQQTNPQTYFNNTIGVKVAMTGVPNVWCDTLWINGYSGGDVPYMCALHTSRDSNPRMWITSQNFGGTSYGTFYQFLTEFNYLDYAVRTTNQSNWNSYSVIGNVVGLLAWKNYGNGHVIFDASQSTSPSGTSVSNTNPDAAWAPAYPTLMGWNGTNTYGVRVDRARLADSVDFNNLTNKTGGTGTYQTNGDFRAPIFYDANDTTYYLDPNGGSYLRGRVLVTGGHGSSALRVFLRADENGSNAGQATLEMWVSEPGVTWNWGGFGYNVTNDNGSPGGFGRINTSFGQAYMRFSDSGDLYFYNTNTSGTRVQTAFYSSNGSVVFGYAVTASSFFESSDKRLKKIVDGNYRLESIASIKPKFYEKNGRLEAGYIAQEVQEIYSHAVQEGTEGYLNLSYGQVHTLKIANLEDSVDEIKKKIKELEEKLNSLY
jgi:hypothetical protein